MTRQFIVVLFFHFYLSSFGQTSQTCSCYALIDYKYKGDILLFTSPNRQESRKLQHNFKDEDFLVVTIKKDSADYFMVDISYSIKENSTEKGWIKKSDNIGTYARNYSSDKTLRLFSKPDINSVPETVLHEWIPELYKVEKCSGKWVFVNVKYKGQTFTGWLQPDKQCANHYSICN